MRSRVISENVRVKIEKTEQASTRTRRLESTHAAAAGATAKSGCSFLNLVLIETIKSKIRSAWRFLSPSLISPERLSSSIRSICFERPSASTDRDDRTGDAMERRLGRTSGSASGDGDECADDEPALGVDSRDDGGEGER